MITCNFRPADDDKKKFEVLSPQLAKPWAFEAFFSLIVGCKLKQADSEFERDDWIKCIQSAVSDGLNSIDIVLNSC